LIKNKNKNVEKKKPIFDKFSIILDLGSFFHVFIFLLSIALLCIGISNFFIGFHNFDTAQNLRLINCETNNDYVDYYNESSYYTPLSQLSIGYDQMLLGLFFSIVGSLILGYYVLSNEILYRYFLIMENKKKK